jgi:ABC-type proline/glycine betaine transport system permease subunit
MGFVVAYSDGMDCPGCGRRLEVSLGSRYLASLAGIAAGVLAWRTTDSANGMLGFALAVLYTFLAYAVVSPLVLMLIADLRVKAEEPAAPEVVPAGHH